MDELIKTLTGFGPWAVVAAIFVWQNWYYQRKIITIVENNTKAFIELREIIEQCLLRGK